MINYNELYPLLLECFDAVKTALDSGNFEQLKKFANKNKLQAYAKEDSYCFENEDIIFEINAVESDEEIKILLYNKEHNFTLSISEDFVIKNENYFEKFIYFFCFVAIKGAIINQLTNFEF